MLHFPSDYDDFRTERSTYVIPSDSGNQQRERRSSSAEWSDHFPRAHASSRKSHWERIGGVPRTGTLVGIHVTRSHVVSGLHRVPFALQFHFVPFVRARTISEFVRRSINHDPAINQRGCVAAKDFASQPPEQWITFTRGALGKEHFMIGSGNREWGSTNSNANPIGSHWKYGNKLREGLKGVTDNELASTFRSSTWASVGFPFHWLCWNSLTL